MIKEEMAPTFANDAAPFVVGGAAPVLPPVEAGVDDAAAGALPAGPDAAGGLLPPGAGEADDAKLDIELPCGALPFEPDPEDPEPAGDEPVSGELPLVPDPPAGVVAAGPLPPFAPVPPGAAPVVVATAVVLAGTPSVASQPQGSVMVTAVGVSPQTVHSVVVTVNP